MRRRDFLRAGFAAPCLASSWLAGCAAAGDLSLAIHPWIGYETLPLARDFGWLPADLALRETRDLNDSARALQAGEVDAACLTLDEVLRLRSIGIPLTVVLVFDVSAGADVVLARPEIGTLAGLAGRRIGVEPGPLGSILLHRMLDAAQLTVDRVEVLAVPTGEQLAAWQQGRIDVVITYEPVSTLLAREGAVRLFDSRRVPDTIMDVLAVRTDQLAVHRTTLKALVAGHFLALRHLQTHRQDAVYRIATRQKIEIDEVGRALAGIMLPSLAANREYLAADRGRLREAAASLSGLMQSLGLVNRPDDLVELVSTACLPDERSEGFG